MSIISIVDMRDIKVYDADHELICIFPGASRPKKTLISLEGMLPDGQYILEFEWPEDKQPNFDNIEHPEIRAKAMLTMGTRPSQFQAITIRDGLLARLGLSDVGVECSEHED